MSKRKVACDENKNADIVNFLTGLFDEVYIILIMQFFAFCVNNNPYNAGVGGIVRVMNKVGSVWQRQ
jgi:hypothetical protein